MRNKTMTLQDIMDAAKALGYTFDEATAQDVLDTKPTWFTENETTEQAVNDYLDAFER
jgi:hypothetical protein